VVDMKVDLQCSIPEREKKGEAGEEDEVAE
jgi:hypothetical protein